MKESNISRRSFLKRLGGGAVATSALLAACKGGASQPNSPAEPPAEGMTMRVNPNTGDRVSLLGYGMMRLPEVQGQKLKEGQEPDFDQDMINRQVDYAIAHGVNYFDTSPAYCRGLSERCTGIALARHPRDTYYIATKLSNFAPDTWPAAASKKMFETSLRELQVDYVDYLLLHGVGMGGMDDLHRRYLDNGILDWLVEQKTAGRIRNLGFSYHGDVAVFDTLLQWHDEGRYHWDFVQVELNYLDWEYANEINERNTDAVYLYGELHKRGIPAVIMEPLLGGRLANVPENVVAKMKSRDAQASVASWAFRFAGTPEGVLTVLSGMTYMEHLRDNLRTYMPLKPLSEEEKEFLYEVADDIFNLNTIPCNDCKYCMPCPYGLNIPAIFVHYNKCIKEGNIPNERMDEEYWQQRRAFLVGYDRSVPRLRQADHCIGCGECVSHCPQGIDIPAEMQRIDEFVEELKRSEK